MVLLALFTALFGGGPADAVEEWVTVRPTDTGEALVNPGMGWTLQFYSNLIENYGSKLEPSDTLDDWPGLSVIYLRVPWSFLEPKEGEFNWPLLDTPAQRWIAKGKKIALRVTCCESWWRYATPRWVQDAGAKGVDFEFGKGPKPGGPLWDPDYLDPVFLDKLDYFHRGLPPRGCHGRPCAAHKTGRIRCICVGGPAGRHAGDCTATAILGRPTPIQGWPNQSQMSENCYDLHYVAEPSARPFSFGVGKLWRIALAWPGCPVPPCIHRAPERLPGQPPRLILIS